MVLSPPSTGPRWKRAAIIAAVATGVAVLFCLAATIYSSVVNSGDTDRVGTLTPPASAAGPVATPVSAPAPPGAQATIGDAVPVSTDSTGATFTVQRIETHDVDEQGGRPVAEVFLLAEVTVAVTHGQIDNTRSGWLFTAGSGIRSTTPQPVPVADRPLYPGGPLAAGEQSTGWLVFDVARADLVGGAVELELRAFGQENQSVTWRL
jgi:hypothetical protein